MAMKKRKRPRAAMGLSFLYGCMPRATWASAANTDVVEFGSLETEETLSGTVSFEALPFNDDLTRLVVVSDSTLSSVLLDLQSANLDLSGNQPTLSHGFQDAVLSRDRDRLYYTSKQGLAFSRLVFPTESGGDYIDIGAPQHIDFAAFTCDGAAIDSSSNLGLSLSDDGRTLLISASACGAEYLFESQTKDGQLSMPNCVHFNEWEEAPGSCESPSGLKRSTISGNGDYLYTVDGTSNVQVLCSEDNGQRRLQATGNPTVRPSLVPSRYPTFSPTERYCRALCLNLSIACSPSPVTSSSSHNFTNAIVRNAISSVPYPALLFFFLL
jgi:hypothetical protein